MRRTLAGAIAILTCASGASADSDRPRAVGTAAQQCVAQVEKNLSGTSWSVTIEVREDGWCGTHPPFAWRGRVSASGEYQRQESARSEWEVQRPLARRELRALRRSLVDACVHPAPTRRRRADVLDAPYKTVVFFHGAGGKDLAAPPGYRPSWRVAEIIGSRAR